MIDRELFETLWVAGVSVPEMARRLGIPPPHVYKWRSKFGIPTRDRVVVQPDDPTPAEIAERARECRERHYAKRRAEKDEAVKCLVWQRRKRERA